MNKHKIFNDPVYGLISIPYPIIFDLIEHRYFQRLRRIKQTGLTHYVYPGAIHTRFHHAMGAMHLMTQAIDILRSKNVEISEKESAAVSIAILLHDIGHGPFSHALEHSLINVTHEDLSFHFMEQLNHEFSGELDLAIKIFRNLYDRPFLHQLVSGQLDMDRMDYLNRDSYFTGVSEGVIGYERIIKMLTVKDGQLAVEEKGIYSIDKFIHARRLMYWQVYLHKTSLGAEQLLIRFLLRTKELVQRGDFKLLGSLQFFLKENLGKSDFDNRRKELLDQFAQLDDVDISFALKQAMHHEDPTLSFLATSLINRRLFKVHLSKTPFEEQVLSDIRRQVLRYFDISIDLLPYYMYIGKESNSAYNIDRDEILIARKDGTVLPMSIASDLNIDHRIITKHFLCYPKVIS